MASTAFAASGEDAITRTIDLSVQHSPSTPSYTSIDDFKDFYEIRRVATDIIQGAFKRIALQFPDELLHDSVPIYRSLNAEIAQNAPEAGGNGLPELYVLADTSYGSCCADEVAAQHVDADMVVHYGHACMSKTYRMPVLYVFGKNPLDVEDCASKLADVVNSQSGEERETVVLRHDVAYAHVADLVLARLRDYLPNSIIQYTKPPLRLDPDPSPSQPVGQASSGNDDHNSNDTDGHPILYIGSESLALTNLVMTHSSSQVYSYDPQTRTTRLESSRTNKLLMRRYATVQRARDSDVFGILIGTLGIASYLPLISHLRTLLSKHRKKTYTISVGKLNPAKLANFMEIECFVLVACPENSLVESKEFHKPIVTPFELEIALRARESWTGRYVLDFEKLLAEAPETGADAEASSGEDPDQPHFSLITGKYRTARSFGGAGPDPSAQSIEADGPSAVILRNQDNTVATLADSAAAEFLQSRAFRGLETRLGEDAPSVLEQGRSGIARGYKNDSAE